MPDSKESGWAPPVRGDACPDRPAAASTPWRGLHADEIARVAVLTSTVAIARRNAIFRQGDAATRVYHVLSGVVRLSLTLADGRRQVVAFLYPGDVLGLSRDNGYAQTAETVTDVKLCAYPLPQFQRLCEAMPRLQRAVLDATMRELVLAQNHIAVVGRKSARERVAWFLLAMAARQHRPGRSGDIVWLPMNQSDISDLLGLSFETVSRTLSALKREGAVTPLSRDIIRIVDSSTIEMAAGDN